MKLKISETLSLPLDAVTNTFAILAKRGVGKTYTGAVMVEEMLECRQQVIVADPIGVWWGLRSSADGKSPGYPIVVFGGEHADVPLEEQSGEIIAQAIIENGFSAILDLSLLRKGAQDRFMIQFAETLYRLNRKPLHFIVDEADAFAPQHPQPKSEQARLLGAFEDIVRRGRARGLGVTLITQRAAVINKNVLTQVEVLVCLRTIAPQDRKAIDAWIEVHGTEHQRGKMMADLPSLPVGTAFFWSPGWLDIFQKVVVRRRRTFDSSSTPRVGEPVVTPKEAAVVDLEQLGAMIKSTVEKAKASDPAELKRQLAAEKKRANELEMKLAGAVVNPNKPQVKTQIKEVPVLTVKERSKLKEIVDSLTKLNCGLETIRCNLVYHQEKYDIIQPALEFIRSVLTGRLAPNPVQVSRPVTASIITHQHHQKISNPVVRSNRTTESNGSLGKCERAILTALAQYPQGRTAVQVALLSEYSVNSGGYNNALGKLRSLDYITRGQPIQITGEGLQALGAYVPLPTGSELVSHWIQSLGRCEASILKFLCDNHPQTFTSQQVGEATGYSPQSGGFNNALGRLRTLELITRGQPMRCSDEFFQ